MRGSLLSLTQKLDDKRFWVLYWYPISQVILVLGIAASWYFFPVVFDWRHYAISALMSQLQNPDGHRLLSFCLVISSCMLLPWPGYLHRRLRSSFGRLATFSRVALMVGVVASVVTGLERLFFQSIIPLSLDLHSLFSLIAFLGLFLGLCGFGAAAGAATIRGRVYFGIRLGPLFLLLWAPFISAGLRQAYLYFGGYSGADWVGPNVPLYMSFAFWEWLALGGVGIYGFATLCLADPPKELTRSSQPTSDHAGEVEAAG